MKKFFAIILLCSSFVVADTSQWTSLNGTWQGVKGQGLSEMPSNGWKDFNVPGKTDSYGIGEATYLWVKRQIDIPANWQDRRIFVRFGGAGYGAHLYIDGKLIGKMLDGWTPFEVEITSAVKPGSSHWLGLRCQDKTAVYPESFVLEPNQPQDALRGKILAPIGGHTMFFGPWDDVWLFSKPDIYIDDIVIIPSTRKNTLTITGTISTPANSDLWVEGKVLDNNELVLKIPASTVSDGNDWQISAAFPNAKYWSPESPYLYMLRLMLRKGKDGPVLDTLDERFGFKEFWIEGPDFYLNGVKLHLLASSTWPIGRWVQSYDEVRKALEMVKAGNNIVFRYHTAPWPKRWMDIADEVGVMIVGEAAVYTDSFGMYAYNDERFWENYRQHLKGFIKRDRNNASLIMWSIENEILFMGMEKYCPDLAKKLGDLGRFVKEIDPYHPITYEADIDPDGAADVIGLHYPHELPTYTDWPNTADWLAERTQTEAGGGMLGVTRRNFYWDRTKPLYIGEYLWVPQQDYSAGTIFYGDDAYIDRMKYHYKAKLQAWYDQSIAYRRAGVSALCPWACLTHGVTMEERDKPFYEAQKDFFRPVAAFLRNKDTRFFSGDTVERTFDVFNDSVTDCDFEMIWYISDAKIKDEQVSRRIKAVERFSLKAGGYKPVNISFAAPEVNLPTEYELKVTLLANGKQVDSVSPKFIISKRRPVVPPGYTAILLANTKILLYDPCGTFSKNIPAAHRISSFSELKDADVKKDIVIISPQISGSLSADGNSQQIGSANADFRNFTEFLAGGGKGIILEQNTLDSFGLNITLAKKSSTMTFPLNKKHPLLKSLTSDELKFWRGDNYVTNYEISRPSIGGAEAITVSGGSTGLEYAGIVEQPVGKGYVLFIQALVGAKFDTEPAARKLLQNALEYMAAKKIKETKTVILDSNAKFMQALVDIGLKQVKIDDIKDSNLKDVDILVLNGGGEKIVKAKDTIAAFLNSSPAKTVYWHCPDAKTFDELKIVFNTGNLEIVSCQGPVAVNLREHQLLSGISREDLLFVKSERGWQKEMYIDPAVIDRAILPRQADSNQQKIEAEELELKAHKAFVNSAAGTVKFESKGIATGWIDIPQSGMYVLSLIAQGTEDRGIYPLVSIRVGDKIVGHISVVQKKTYRYPLLAELPAGKNKLEINFINGSDWGGGRELVLDGLVVSEKVDIPENIKILTLPAALMSISAGKGRVIIDTVRWDDNEQNKVKGQRYISALFANLGASFELLKKDEITWLALDSFNLVGESPYFDKTNTQISLRNNGTVAAGFNCASRGNYTIFLKGYSTPAKNQYAVIEVRIDDKIVGNSKEIESNIGGQFEIGNIDIPAGPHKVSVSFVNDAYDNGQDRNFFMGALGFKGN